MCLYDYVPGVHYTCVFMIMSQVLTICDFVPGVTICDYVPGGLYVCLYDYVPLYVCLYDYVPGVHYTCVFMIMSQVLTICVSL